MIPFFWPFGWFFVFINLKIASPSVDNMCKKFSCEKICHVIYKSLYIHFLHFLFFTKIFMHYYIHMWKITTTMQIIKYFSLKFIRCRFYIWKIAKTKPLSHVSKKEGRNHEYAHVRIKTKISIGL
jgi:hypothetical protein